ncbi:MAG: carbohydrate binding domain-containing protein, partial [Candidatus Margulisiibacteriota bacterium]
MINYKSLLGLWLSLFLFFLLTSNICYADITIGVGLNVNVGSVTPTSSPTLTIPIFSNIPSLVSSPKVSITGAVDNKTTKVKLLVNTKEITIVNVINKIFTFNDVFLTSANNQISAIAMDDGSSASDPATATILYPNFTKLYKDIDLIDYSITDWGNWGYINNIFQTVENNNNILVINQDFNFKPATEDNWGGILWKSIPDWQKDFSQFKKITYQLKNDGTHPQVTVRFAIYEASGELWQEKSTHTLTNSWQDITTYLNEATFQLVEDQWNKKINGKLDLKDVSKVAFFIMKNTASGSHTLYVGNITGNGSDLSPPTISIAEAYTSQNNYILSGTLPANATS